MSNQKKLSHVTTANGVTVDAKNVRENVRLVLANGVEVLNGHYVVQSLVKSRGVVDENLVDSVTHDVLSIQNNETTEIDAILKRLENKPKNPNHTAGVLKHREDFAKVMKLCHAAFMEQKNMSATNLFKSKYGLYNGRLSFFNLSALAAKEKTNIQTQYGTDLLKEGLAHWNYQSSQIEKSIDLTGEAFKKFGFVFDHDSMGRAMMFEIAGHDIEKLLSVRGYTENDVKNVADTSKWSPDQQKPFMSSILESQKGQLELFQILGDPPTKNQPHRDKTQNELADIARAVGAHNLGTKHHPNFSLPEMHATLIQYIVVTTDICTYRNFLKSIDTFRGNYNYDDVTKEVFQNTYSHLLDYIRRQNLHENPKTRGEIRDLFPNIDDKTI